MSLIANVFVVVLVGMMVRNMLPICQGYASTEEEFTLLEAGKAGTAKAAAGDNGVEMCEVDIQQAEQSGNVNRQEARAQGKVGAEMNGSRDELNGHGSQHDDATETEGVRARAVPKSDTICEIMEGL